MTFSYQYTPQAAVAIDDGFPFQHTTVSRKTWSTLWASKGFSSSKGKCVAVRFDGDECLQIAVVRDGIRKWYPASKILSEEQLQLWSRRDIFTV